MSPEPGPGRRRWRWCSGAVLGVGLAFLVDTLDERMRNAADLERISGGAAHARAGARWRTARPRPSWRRATTRTVPVAEAFRGAAHRA